MTRRTPEERALIKLYADVTEKMVQASIEKAAKLVGFGMIYHTHRSDRSPAGFPDLVMLHRSGRMVVVECKRQDNDPTDDQVAWLDGFDDLSLGIKLDETYKLSQDRPPWVAVYVAKPSNLADVLAELGKYAAL